MRRGAKETVIILRFQVCRTSVSVISGREASKFKSGKHLPCHQLVLIIQERRQKKLTFVKLIFWLSHENEYTASICGRVKKNVRFANG